MPTRRVFFFLPFSDEHVRPLEFFERFKQVCGRLSLQSSLSDVLKLLERKYVVTHLLFRKYEKLFRQVVEMSDVKENAVSQAEALKFGWLVFLVAKEKILTDPIPDLVSALNVLICALSFTLYNWEALNDPGVLALSRMCGCESEKVSQLRQNAFDQVIYSLVQNGILSAAGSLPQSDEGRMRGFMLAANVAANMVSLEREYRRTAKLHLDETLALLSPSPPEGTPARSAMVSLQAPLSPHTGLLKSVDLLAAMVRHVHADEPSAGLRKFFGACGGETDHFDTGKKLLLSIRERLQSGGIDVPQERFVFLQKMYFLLLETLLRSEEDKLQQKGTNFSLLLSNESFHRSLVWCACEIVFYSFRVDRACYPHNLAPVGVSALDLIKIIESVLRNLTQVSSVMVRRFSDIEEHLLDSLAWKRNEALFRFLQSHGAREALAEWMGSDLPSHQQQHQQMQQQQQQQQHQQQQHSHLALGAHVGFVSPMRPKSAPAPALSFGLKLFFRKITALVTRRVEQLCSALGMAFLIQSQICKTVLHTLVKTSLPFERHLDQLIMCAVYAVGKVYWKSVGAAAAGEVHEITFREIILCYKALPHYTWQSPSVFRDVLISGDRRGSVIDFYNQLFVPELDEFVLRFQAEYSHILGTPLALITPRSMRINDATATLESGGGGPAPAPVAGPVATFRNVSVSPMKNRTMQSPVNSFRTTKLGFAGGKSPSKDLAHISAALKSGKRLEPSPGRMGLAAAAAAPQPPPQQRKRLWGVEEDDERGGGGADSDDQSALTQGQQQQERRGSNEFALLLKVSKELEEEPASPKKKAAK
jgi:hypothetical protein